MPKEPQDSPSRAKVPLELLRASIAGTKQAFTSTKKSRAKKHGASGYRRDVVYAYIRQLLAGLSTQQVQFLTPTTDKMYNRIAKARRVKPNSLDLPEDAQAHWIGDPKAQSVMLYSHGGGFYGAATYAHVNYLFTLQKDMEKAGHSFAILLLTYTLSPKGLYPLQLRQAASALDFLLTNQKRDPATVLLGGDSAGGGLTAALLQHIAHPHPKVPTIQLKSPLHSALMISPWVSCQTSWPSFEANARSDLIDQRAFRRAVSAFIEPGTQHDSYSEPNLSPPEWWADIAKGTVRNVFIWGGGGEVLLDGIKQFADKVSAGFSSPDVLPTGEDKGEKGPGRFKFVVTEGCCHEEMIIDELALGMVKGDAAREVDNWLSAVLE